MKKIKKKDFLELETRRITYNYILNNPGLHLREISRDLSIPKTTLKYHLDFLKKQDMIIVRSDKKYLRYYITQRVGNLDKDIMGLIRQDIPRKIILFLFLYPGNSRTDLSGDLDKSPTTISYHLKKLEKKDVVLKYKHGRKTVYKLKDQKNMYRFLITYEKSLAKDIALTHLLNWVRYAIPDGIPKRKPGDKRDIEDIEKVLYEIFPHPYHN